MYLDCKLKFHNLDKNTMWKGQTTKSWSCCRSWAPPEDYIVYDKLSIILPTARKPLFILRIMNWIIFVHAALWALESRKNLGCACPPTHIEIRPLGVAVIVPILCINIQKNEGQETYVCCPESKWLQGDCSSHIANFPLGTKRASGNVVHQDPDTFRGSLI